jgi:histidinol-phosphate phosphatase family protein
MFKRAALLDKDGTLLDDVPFNVDPALMRFAPGARAALAMLAENGFSLFVISNQGGVALGRFTIDALSAVEARLHEMFASCGVELAGVYWCPHHPQGVVARYAMSCTCRKPAPGLILRAASEHGIDLHRSWFIGDILDDVEAGARAGCRTVLLDNGHETEWRDGPMRTPTLRAPDLYRAAVAIVEASKNRHAGDARAQPRRLVGLPRSPASCELAGSRESSEPLHSPEPSEARR